MTDTDKIMELAHNASKYDSDMAWDELLAAVTEQSEQLRVAQSAYEQTRQDCWNLTEKVIPNIRQELEAAKADLNAELRGNAAMRIRLGAMDGETMFTFTDRLVSERDALKQELEAAKELIKGLRLELITSLGQEIEAAGAAPKENT